MTVVLINPNSTAAMTQAALEAARAAAPELDLMGWTSDDGPPAIQGPADGAVAVPPLLQLVRRADANGACGIIIACFDDTGLDEARALASCPVIGIGQAAYTLAALMVDRYSVVTTMPAAIPVLEQNIQARGFAPAVQRVLAADVPVLDLDQPSAETYRRLHSAIAEAQRDDIGAIVLGCSGMVSVIDRLRKETPLPLIDGVTAAAQLMRCTALRAAEPALA